MLLPPGPQAKRHYTLPKKREYFPVKRSPVGEESLGTFKRTGGKGKPGKSLRKKTTPNSVPYKRNGEKKRGNFLWGKGGFQGVMFGGSIKKKTPDYGSQEEQRKPSTPHS